MSKFLRCLTIALSNIPNECKIVLGYLTYHSGKLFNQAIYFIKTKKAKINTYDLYKKLKNSSLYLKNLQFCSAQIVLNELVRAFENWFEYLQTSEKLKRQTIKPLNFRPKNKSHRTFTYDKTSFKIVETKVRLSLFKNLRKWLKKKQGIELKYFFIDAGLELNVGLIKNIQIAPKTKEFELHIIYEKHQNKTTSVKGERVMVLDLNPLNFFATLIEGVKRPYNKNKKSKLNKVADQIWSLLPHGKVKEYLKYKAKEYGIEVEYLSEVYMLGVDSSCSGTVSKENYTFEARIKRGLFRTKFLRLLNADANACRNFLKKLWKFDLINSILCRIMGGMNLLVVIRHPIEGINPSEAPYL